VLQETNQVLLSNNKTIAIKASLFNMDILLNVLSFILALTLITLSRDMLYVLKIKEYASLAIGCMIGSLLWFLCAKYLDVGIAVFGQNNPMRNPEAAAEVSYKMFIFFISVTPIAYIVELFYYKKYPQKDRDATFYERRQAIKKKRKDRKE